LNVYGSLRLNPNMVFSFRGAVNFLASTSGHTINMAGHRIRETTTFAGLGGGWTLSSPMQVDTTLFIKAGNLNTGNQNLSCLKLFVIPTSLVSLNLGSSRIKPLKKFVIGPDWQEYAGEWRLEEMTEAARKSVGQGITEIHIVGGLHPSLPYSFYLELLRSLAALEPRPTLKVFTAIEIRHLAERIAKKSIDHVLAELKEAGLGSLTGGGAEIFDAGVRDQICRGKESAEEWLEVHRIWHGMGGRSTATMLYGHVETAAQRVEHLEKLRSLQDETGGFTGFVPFAFEPSQTRLAELGKIRRASALEELRVMAASRLILDNFDHITAYWISTGLPLAQVALSYGADDLHGTIEEEKIFHMAGAKTPVGQTRENMVRVIREAGREPVQRDTFYEPVPVQV
jgi:aminodeoxyfutalosine synthase